MRTYASHRAHETLIAVLGLAGLVGLTGSATGCMLNPGNGRTETSTDVDTAAFTHNGYHTSPNATVNLQVLTPSNADLSTENWQTYGSAVSRSTPSYFFSNDFPEAEDNPLYLWTTPSLSPGQGLASRWRQGGVARVRAITPDNLTARIFDTNYLNCSEEVTRFTEFSEKCGSYASYAVLVSTSPTPADRAAPPAARWLTDGNPDPDQENTREYYRRIGAGPGGALATLTAFRSTFGFGTGGDEASAIYFNNGDLGLGRSMRCRSSGSRRACYVTNFADRDAAGIPIFGGDDARQQSAIAQAIAGTNPIATVAMVYDPGAATNKVTFVVYGADNNPVFQAPLDNHGARGQSGTSVSVPKNCMACHGGGGGYDPAAFVTTRAHFLPFDPFSFVGSSTNTTYSISAQQTNFQKLNAHVYAAGATPATQQMLQAMYSNASGPVPGRVAVADAVPSGWTASWKTRQLYTNVVAPYCRTCHMSRESGDLFAFSTYSEFDALKTSIVNATCGSQRMPHAEQAQRVFWASGARAHLLAWTGATGDCRPN